MKIGLYDPYLDDIGGGERYMMTIASCLSKNHEVDVFWDDRTNVSEIQKRFSIDLSKVTLKPNIFRQDFSKVKKLKVSKNYDLIILLSDGSIPFLLSKKTFLHMQQPISHSLSFKDRLKLKKIDKIFCNSSYTKDFIEKNYGVTCSLLYPPVSIFRTKINKENMILHVGRFRVVNVKSNDYKKQQFMIDTFKKMVDEGLLGWKFLLGISVGDVRDQKFQKMKNSIKGYPIEFLVNQTKDKLWGQASRAKIYWHATGYGEDLKKNPQLAEHFGISTVEAMGVGAVPVVINAGGQKEIVEDGVNGFLWESSEEFKEKTIKLIKSDKLLKKMSEEAYARSKYFSEESFCKRVYDLIND